MNNDFLSKVFKWFGIGLLVTFLIGYLVSTTDSLLYFVYSGYTTLVICILEIVCAIWLSARINKMSTQLATGLYLGYTVLTGLTFSSIFILYELQSIIWIFLATSIIFLIFSFIGKSIKMDLSGFGLFLLVGLFAIIILEVINIFVMSGTLDMVSCIISLIIFIGYVAYDMQRISRMSNYSGYYNEDNYAIIWAFNIYLDFINILLSLLRLFGDRRD